MSKQEIMAERIEKRVEEIEGILNASVHCAPEKRVDEVTPGNEEKWVFQIRAMTGSFELGAEIPYIPDDEEMAVTFDSQVDVLIEKLEELTP